MDSASNINHVGSISLGWLLGLERRHGDILGAGYLVCVAKKDPTDHTPSHVSWRRFGSTCRGEIQPVVFKAHLEQGVSPTGARGNALQASEGQRQPYGRHACRPVGTHQIYRSNECSLDLYPVEDASVIADK